MPRYCGLLKVKAQGREVLFERKQSVVKGYLILKVGFSCELKPLVRALFAVCLS